MPQIGTIMKTRSLMALILASALATTAAAQNVEYSSVKTKKVAVATTAASGQKLAYLCTDHPEVTALVVEIPPGGETGWHLHEVPVYAYMLEGTITVELEEGKSHVFNKGDAIFEVRFTSHNGRNTGGKPAKMIVLYTGEEGKPNVTRTPVPENK